MMPEISFWAQFGLAGLFGAFSIYLTNRFLNHASEQSEDHRTHIATENEKWQTFMKGEQQQRADIMHEAVSWMTRLNNSLSELDKTLIKLNGEKLKQ